jgi:hypothetical protein
MRQFKGADPAHVGRLQPRFSLRTLAFAALLLLLAFLYGRSQMRASGGGTPQTPPQPEVQVALPAILPGLFDGVDDATPEMRVRLERNELEGLKASVRQLVPAHFELEQSRFLSPETGASLSAEPASQRGSLISARGRLTRLGERSLSNGQSEWFGTAETEDGLPFHFVALDAGSAAELGPGDWVRIDGLFFKRFASEDPSSGAWLEGPLLLAREAQRSFEGLGPVLELEPALLRGLSDDTLDVRPGLPELIRWLALAWMRDMPEGAIDWANAPLLDQAAMSALMADGDAHRGQAYRMPVSFLQALTAKRVGENPARLSQVSEGWIGNTNWPKANPVLTFIAPGQLPAMARQTKVVAELVFLKHLAYDTVENTRAVAPLFALHRLEVQQPPDLVGMRYLTMGFIGVLALMTAAMFFLVRRDQRRSRELQDKLRASRRGRRATSGSPA